MGALTPVTSLISGIGSTVLPVLSTVDTLSRQISDLGRDPEEERRAQLRAQQDQALRQLQQRQRSELGRARSETQLEQEEIAARSAGEDKRRRRALKRAVARQRADFAGRGISPADAGSAEAVLLGLFEESEAEKQDRDRLDRLRNKALEQDLGNLRRRNVLERTHLAERHRLRRSFLS